MKKRIENIGLLNKGLCKGKIVFAHPRLLFGTVGEARAHCPYLQIAQAKSQPKFAKECNLSKRT